MEGKFAERIVRMLGFAARAGRILFGTDTVCKSLGARGEREVRLVLLSKNASDATKRKLGYKCEFYKKPLIVIDMDGEELGRLLGKSYAAMVIAVNDARFADEIIKAESAYREEIASDQTEQVKGSFPQGNR